MFWVLRCPLERMEVKSGLWDPAKMSLGPWAGSYGRDRGVSSIEVITTAKIMWTFFRDQILSSLIGGVPEERFHCVRGFFCFIHSLISRTAVNQEEAVVWRKETSVDFPLPDKRKMSDWKLMTRAHWRANFTDFLHVYAPLVYFYFSLLPWGKILRGSFFAALFPFGS